MQAGRTHAAGIESVPSVTAGAGPQLMRTRRPIARRAANARARAAALFLVAGFGAQLRLDNNARSQGANREHVHA